LQRGGVIYVNAEDVGWRPVVDSWIEKLEAAEYRPLLAALFTRYVDATLEYCRRNFKTVVPLPAINQVGLPFMGGSILLREGPLALG
jgi:dynein heavy chain